MGTPEAWGGGSRTLQLVPPRWAEPTPPHAPPLAPRRPHTHPVHVLILEEEHVGVRAVLPELLHVLEPGAVAHYGDKDR